MPRMNRTAVDAAGASHHTACSRVLSTSSTSLCISLGPSLGWGSPSHPEKNRGLECYFGPYEMEDQRGCPQVSPPGVMFSLWKESLPGMVCTALSAPTAQVGAL